VQAGLHDTARLLACQWPHMLLHLLGVCSVRDCTHSPHTQHCQHS
jgi:hypothetical protein